MNQRPPRTSGPGSIGIVKPAGPIPGPPSPSSPRKTEASSRKKADAAPSTKKTEADAVLEQVRHAAMLWALEPSQHARERMRERNARAADVRRAIETATKAVQQSNGTWKIVGGKDTDDEDLEVAVDVEKYPICIVTVF